MAANDNFRVERILIKTFDLLNQSRKLPCVMWPVANAGSELYSVHCWNSSQFIFTTGCDGHSAYKHYPVAKTVFMNIN